MKRLLKLILVAALCAGFYTLGQRPDSPRIADWLDRPAETADADHQSDRSEWIDTTLDRARSGLRTALRYIAGEDAAEKEPEEVATQTPSTAEPLSARRQRQPIPQCW